MTYQPLAHRGIIRNVEKVCIPRVGLRVVPEAVGVVRAVLAGHEHVLEDPTHPGGVGSELRADIWRQKTRDEAELLQDAAAGPVHVGAVFEDDVDEAAPEHAVAAHDLGFGHGEHGRGQRIGDLVLDDLRGLAGVLGPDDHLNVRKVGDGIDLDAEDRPHTCDDHERREKQDHRPVVDAQ